MPTGVNEKNDRPSNPASSSVDAATRFGGVPISVIIPPILLAKAIGISIREEFMLDVAAILTTIGSISATVPVLLTKAPMKDVTSITSTNSFHSLPPAAVIIRPLIFLASPVRKIPPPTMNSPAIIITIELEKPERASAGVSIPHNINASRLQSATISERMRPFMKSTTDIARIVSVIAIKNTVIRLRSLQN